MQITDHFLSDDPLIYVNKGNQRQMRDQSCGQRQGPVLALMINTLPPATSLAVAPEASLEAAEHRSERSGDKEQQVASAAFLNPSTSARKTKCMEKVTFGFSCSLKNKPSDRYIQDQILNSKKRLCVQYAQKEKKTLCRLSPVNCNSKTSGPRGYFFLSLRLTKDPFWCDQITP